MLLTDFALLFLLLGLFLLLRVYPVEQDYLHIVGRTVTVSLLKEVGQFLQSKVTELIKPLHRHTAHDGHEVEDGQALVTLHQLVHEELLLVVLFYHHVTFQTHATLFDVEENLVGIALLAVVLVDWLIGESKVHLTCLAQLVEFLLRGFEDQGANFIILVEGVIGLFDGSSLLGKLSLGNLVVLQLLGEPFDAVGHVTIVVDAQERTELFVVEGLALRTIAVERKEDIDTRCALLLTNLRDAGNMHGVAPGHREEIVYVVLIHFDTDLTSRAGSGDILTVAFHQLVGNVH